MGWIVLIALLFEDHCCLSFRVASEEWFHCITDFTYHLDLLYLKQKVILMVSSTLSLKGSGASLRHGP